MRTCEKMCDEDIVEKLLRFGKKELLQWSRDMFIAICMCDFDVDEPTAKRVYTQYRDAMKALARAERENVYANS